LRVLELISSFIANLWYLHSGRLLIGFLQLRLVIWRRPLRLFGASSDVGSAEAASESSDVDEWAKILAILKESSLVSLLISINLLFQKPIAIKNYKEYSKYK